MCLFNVTGQIVCMTFENSAHPSHLIWIEYGQPSLVYQISNHPKYVHTHCTQSWNQSNPFYIEYLQFVLILT